MELLGVSRSKVQKYIADGRVTVNGALPKKSGDRLRSDSTIVVEIPDTTREERVVTEIQPAKSFDEYGVRVIAETPTYLILHKPAGLLVHATEAGESETLAAWIVAHYPEIKDVGESPVRPGIVHRIDKDASGLLVVARTQDMFTYLKQQFKERRIEKYYTVLVHEVVARDHEQITFAIDRGAGGRMVARPYIDLLKVKNVNKAQPGKEALTEFWVDRRFTRFTLLRVRIHTGRMHQIRVHMLAYNHPVVGDMMYFNKKLNRKRDLALGRIFLHASELRFINEAGDLVTYTDSLPTELQVFLSDLR